MQIPGLSGCKPSTNPCHSKAQYQSLGTQPIQRSPLYLLLPRAPRKTNSEHSRPITSTNVVRACLLILKASLHSPFLQLFIATLATLPGCPRHFVSVTPRWPLPKSLIPSPFISFRVILDGAASRMYVVALILHVEGVSSSFCT